MALRKMLGDIQSKECTALMRLIETQSRQTLAQWAVTYAEANYLPVFQKGYPKDTQMQETIALCKSCLAGEIKLAELKPALKECRQAAAGTEGAAEQAAARAVATACAAIQTPTNTFGFLLYGASAAAYDNAGLEEERDVYDALASAELKRALASLEATAVAGEPNPVKIKWSC